MALIAGAGKLWRYTRGLAEFWRNPYDPARSLAALQAAHAAREARFLAVMHDAIYTRAGSPYLWLLRTAGIEEGDLTQLVQAEGIEGALQALHRAGVYVTLAEFKGHTGLLRRGSQSRAIAPADWDNPLSSGHLEGRSGGSRSRGTVLHLDLGDAYDELPARYLHLTAHGIERWPFAFYRPASSLATLRMILTQVKLGCPMAGWFSPTEAGIGGAGGGSGMVFSWATLALSRLMGHGLVPPEYVPLHAPARVVQWLAERTAAGESVVLYAMANTGAILCTAALASGADIHGHHLRTTAEPLTAAKAALYTRAGLTYSSAYGMTEAGGLGLSCGNPTVCDEMHLLDYRSALLPIPRAFPGHGEPVQALWASVFSRQSPRMMLNVETGDYATFVQRSCGCALEAAGLTRRVHTVRSYEKLTSAGMNFLGGPLLEVLEEALPARFGGGPGDYQMVEGEEDGLTRVRLVIHPRLGDLDADAVVAYTLEQLARRTRGGRMQAEMWRTSNTLGVERAEPYRTSGAKIQALHVEPPREESHSEEPRQGHH